MGKDEEGNGKDNFGLVLWAFFGTGLWTGISAIILWKAGLPTNSSEWGDFFAGAFAPLAFLWFLVTVYIQAKELRQNRREFELNREVLAAQAEEAKRQATFIEQQTRLLLKADRIRSFEGELELLEAVLRRHADCWTFTCAGEPLDFQFDRIIRAGDTHYILAMSILLFNHILQGNSGKKLDETWQSTQPTQLENVLAASKSCQVAAYGLPSQDRSKAKELEIDDLVATIQKIYDVTVVAWRNDAAECDGDDAKN